MIIWVNGKNLDNDWNNKLGKKQFIGPPSQSCGEKEYLKHNLETLKPELHQLPASSQSVDHAAFSTDLPVSFDSAPFKAKPWRCRRQHSVFLTFVHELQSNWPFAELFETVQEIRQFLHCVKAW